MTSGALLTNPRNEAMNDASVNARTEIENDVDVQRSLRRVTDRAQEIIQVWSKATAKPVTS